MIALLMLTAACEGLGLGLLAAVAIRMARPMNPLQSVVDVRAWVALCVAMTSVAGVLLVHSPGLVVELIVLCLVVLVYVVLGLLIGDSVLDSGGPSRPTSHSLAEPREIADLGRRLADTSGQIAELTRELAVTSAALAESRRREQIADIARRQLVTWFSRGLHSPMNRMMGTLESEVDTADSDHAPGMLRLRSEARRLADTVGDLVHLSKVQDGSLSPAPASVSLDDLVSDAVAELGEVAAEADVRLFAGDIEPVVIAVDHREMARAVRELLTNAIRSCGPGATVSVDTRSSISDAVVSITDECGGIAERDLDSVFEAGWRGADAEDRGGLGLAIVHGIVRAHRGHVLVRNVPGGCCFEIRLPLTAT